MFENVLKGTKAKKGSGLKAFGSKDTNRWKKEGSVKSMTKKSSLPKLKPGVTSADRKRWKREVGWANKKIKPAKLGLSRKRKGNWGTWEQRLWVGMDPNSPFHKP